MGKRGGKKHFGGRGGKKGGRDQTRFSASEFIRKHESFERYYNGLGVVPDDEKEEFWATLRRDLPNSFRFTGSKSHALAVQKRLKEFYVPEITSITHEGNPVEPPQPVSWYPDQLAWAMTTPKSVVRKFAPFASFQKFLVAESEVGNISRQEVVSMIPPLLMDIKPGMTVLDLCAAPGSKSCQLMEMIHAGEEERMQQAAENREMSVEGTPAENGLEDDGRTTGLLIANDSDYKRAHLLIHQMKRLNSPNLIVTNHDATMYPSIKLPNDKAGTSGNKYLKFDRILADVPCSGDGTARKNMNIWKIWTPSNALGLHITQVRILLRALQMLKVGGRVVYSTCSMNPVENEAVVATAIRRCGGPSKVKIVDCSQELPTLKRSSGLKSWNVMDKSNRVWDSWSDAEAQREKEGDDRLLGRVSAGMFPPTGENEEIPLERCIRVYPHQQDTGGFFITVLEKLTEIKTKPEEPPKAASKAPVTAVVEEMEAQPPTKNGEPPAKLDSLDEMLPAEDAPTLEREKNASVTESTHMSATSPSASVKRGPEHLEEESPTKRMKTDGATETTTDAVGDRPVHFPPPGTDTDAIERPVAATQPSIPAEPPKKRRQNQPFEEPFKFIDPYHEELVRIYDFYGISPFFPRDRFMVRNAEGRPAKTIYYTSLLARDILVENEGKGIKFVHCGVKMFVKQDVQRDHVCPWRIQTDGLTLLESYVHEDRVVILTKKDTLWKLLIEMFPKVNGDGWRNLGEIGEWVRDVDMGCCVLRIEPTGKENGLTERMVFPLWRSLYSLNLMLPKEERRAMLLRLFNDDTPLINTTGKKDDAAAAAAQQSATPTEPESATNGNADIEVGDADDVDEEDGGVLLETTGKEEESAIKKENLALGQQEDEAMKARQSFVAVEGEDDLVNKTV
ncbi:hypothetical protein FQN54_000129 [Arachnomyces sp. PD_36]|nr:hypothetical protein FQN54_000129 [Arachnomyces sp. PD_36]